MFELDRIKRIVSFITDKKYTEIKGLLPPHPEDIANIISHLPSASYKLLVFRLVPYSRAIDVFEYLSIEEEEEMLKSLSSQEIKDILNEMSPDDRTELFEEMPAELVNKFMSLLSPDERKFAVAILNYPTYSVGRLITPDFVQLYENMTAQEALAQVRKVGLKKETVYHCYVLDAAKRLIGIVSLKKLVLADPQIKTSEIMFRDVIKASAFTDQEEAANIFKKYDLIVLPVVDNSNKLLGIVTFDDLVDVLEDETTEDFEKIAAILPVEKPYMEASVFNIIWKRSFWLIVLISFESVSAFVLQSHHQTISQVIALTFFIPILVAMGGNTGTQSATLIIRSLATGDVKVKEFFKVIFRESFIGLFIGIILACAGAIVVAILQQNLLLSIAVSISMGVTIILAATVGAGLPILFRKLKLDPALMSGPLIATIVDVVGILIYFQIAKAVLRL